MDIKENTNYEVAFKELSKCKNEFDRKSRWLIVTSRLNLSVFELQVFLIFFINF